MVNNMNENKPQTPQQMFNQKRFKLNKMRKNHELLTEKLKIMENNFKRMNKNADNLKQNVINANTPLKKSERTIKSLQIRSNFLKKLSNEYDKEQASLNKMLQALNKTQKMINKQQENIESKRKQIMKLNAKKNLEIPNNLNTYPHKNEYMQFFRDHNLSKPKNNRSRVSNRGAELWRKVKSESLLGGTSSTSNVRHKQQAKITKTKTNLNLLQTNINSLF